MGCSYRDLVGAGRTEHASGLTEYDVAGSLGHVVAPLDHGSRVVSGLLPAALFDLAGSKGVDCASLAREVDIRQSLDPDDRVPLASVLSLWATLIARFPSNPLGLELCAGGPSRSACSVT